MTVPLFDVPVQVTPIRSAKKVFLAIEIPEDVLLPENVWPHGGPAEGWSAQAVYSELRIQYGESISLRTLADEWGIGDRGGELIIRDDAGNLIKMELRS